MCSSDDCWGWFLATALPKSKVNLGPRAPKLWPGAKDKSTCKHPGNKNTRYMVDWKGRSNSTTARNSLSSFSVHSARMSCMPVSSERPNERSRSDHRSPSAALPPTKAAATNRLSLLAISTMRSRILSRSSTVNTSDRLPCCSDLKYTLALNVYEDSVLAIVTSSLERP